MKNFHAEFDVILGSSGSDTLSGTPRKDFISGRKGNDTIFGFEGNDYLVGGAGDDNLEGGAGSDILDGGGGLDRVTYVLSPAPVNIDLMDITLNYDLGNIDPSLSGHFVDAVVLTNQPDGSDAVGDVLISIERLIGSIHDDVLLGDDGINRISGDFFSAAFQDPTLGGNDIIFARGGDDTIFGNAGADFIHGGDGNDTASMVGSTAGVTIDLSTTQQLSTLLTADKIAQLTAIDSSIDGDTQVVVGQGGAAQGDILVSIESVIGSAHNDILTGNDQNNILVGAGGSDELFGNEGDDNLRAGGVNGVIDTSFLSGGDGDDFFFGGFTDIGEMFIYDGGAGSDIFEVNVVDAGLGNGSKVLVALQESIVVTIEDFTLNVGGEGDSDILRFDDFQLKHQPLTTELLDKSSVFTQMDVNNDGDMDTQIQFTAGGTINLLSVEVSSFVDLESSGNLAVL